MRLPDATLRTHQLHLQNWVLRVCSEQEKFVEEDWDRVEEEPIGTLGRAASRILEWWPLVALALEGC